MSRETYTPYGELFRRVAKQIGTRDAVLRALGGNRTQWFDRNPKRSDWRLAAHELAALYDLAREAPQVLLADWNALVSQSGGAPAQYPLRERAVSLGTTTVYSYLRAEPPPSAWSERRNRLFRGEKRVRPAAIYGMYNHIPALFRSDENSAAPATLGGLHDEDRGGADAYRVALRQERTAILDGIKREETDVKHLYSLPALRALITADQRVANQINTLLREARQYRKLAIRAVDGQTFPLEFTIVDPPEVVLIEVPQVLPVQGATRSINGVEIGGSHPVSVFTVQFQTVWNEALSEADTIAALRQLLPNSARHHAP